MAARHFGKRGKLTERQKKFVAEYLNHRDAKRAAIDAGYKEKTAGQAAHNLLAKPHVAELVNKKVAQQLQNLEITAEKVLAEIASLAFSNMEDFSRVNEEGLPELDFSKLSRTQWAAVQEYTEDATGGTGDGERRVVLRRKLKLASKAQALELLAKHFKLLTERVEVDVSDNLIEKLAMSRQRRELRIAS